MTAKSKHEILQEIIDQAEHELNHAQAKLAEWQERFANDAREALLWSTSIFDLAAQERVLKEFFYYVSDDGPWELAKPEMALAFYSETRKTMLNKTRWPERSTSPAANLMDQAENAARAEFLAANAKVDPKNARAQYKLALEASELGLDDLAAAAYRRVIAVDTDHRAARRALGSAGLVDDPLRLPA